MGALRISNYVSTDTNEYYYINSIIMSALLSCTFEKKNNVCIAQIGFQDLVKRFDGFGLSGYCLNILQTTKPLNNVALASIRKNSTRKSCSSKWINRTSAPIHVNSRLNQIQCKNGNYKIKYLKKRNLILLRQNGNLSH